MHDHAHHALALGDAGFLPFALFLMGLAGGFTHCAGMCGPFVLAQAQAGLARLPVEALEGFGRIRAGLLLPYHLGRFVTYAGLGAAAAATAGALAEATGFRWLLAAVLAVGAVILLLQALDQAGLRIPRLAPGLSTGLGALLGRRVSPLLDGPGPARGFVLGLILGFLPCGLIYAALAAAAGAGNAAAGGLAMAGFALGTVPALVVVGAAGAALGTRIRRWARWVAVPLLLLNAAVLLWLALAVIA